MGICTILWQNIYKDIADTFSIDSCLPQMKADEKGKV